jgi:transposase, IS5 family
MKNDLSSRVNVMRETIKSQMQFGEVDISKIEFDLRCRDEIPKLLMGLQHLYCTPEVRQEIFSLLEKLIPPDVDIKKGRRGMELWRILVLGTLRLNCNWDYDKLQDISNNHATLRQMLGHGLLDEHYYYPLQTLRDNVSLLTPEILAEINEIVVKTGHSLLGKKNELPLKGRGDSFVVETDVHFPTDINLLYDAARKTLTLIGQLSKESGLTCWRQWKHLRRTIKKLYRTTQKLKHSTSRNQQKKNYRVEAVKAAHQQYTDVVEEAMVTAQASFPLFRPVSMVMAVRLQEIEKFVMAGHRLIDQIRRRVLRGETIPHEEKIFSLFQPHTEWISKGKAGVPQELGVRVAIVEDQFGFILHHQVMEKQQDAAIAVALIQETKDRFPNLRSCSLDKGFYTPENKKILATILSVTAMCKKGRLTVKETEFENSPEFLAARQKHAAVESGINALENHGLDRCLDDGIRGFKRYVALAVVARNIQKLGHILQQREKQRRDRIVKIQATMRAKQLTAG